MQRILILAANPKNTSRLRLDQELRDIKAGLRRAKHRDEFAFAFAHRLAVRLRDIQRAMLEETPQIVHFSGHGEGAEGLVFEDDSGQAQRVSGAALANLFALFADPTEPNPIHCVVLNGCYSQVQAEVIAEQVPYVVGMTQAMGDRAAIEFAVSFYDALGAGRTVDFAFKLGCAAIDLAGRPENATPVLLNKKALPAPATPAESANATTIPQDRTKLYQLLLSLPGPQFDAVVFDLNPPRGNLPPSSAPQGDRVAALLNWVESPIGPGLAALRTSLANVLGLRLRDRNEERLIDAVNTEVSYFRDQSLPNAPSIRFGMVEQLSQVNRQWDGELRTANQKTKALPPGTSIVKVFDRPNIGGKLLILGSPGIGKTTTLLNLAATLIQRANDNPNEPIPVVVNLRSWHNERQSLIDWLLNELKMKYKISQKVGQKWLRENNLLPLFDGLDELPIRLQKPAVETINQWLRSAEGASRLVVCSRLESYEGCGVKLELNGAILLNLLTDLEVKDHVFSILRKPHRAQCFTEPAIQLDLMLIPGGTFTMGSPPDELGRYDNEGPQHEVTVPTFLMGRYPVTQAQWQAVATRTDLKINTDLDPDPADFKGDNRPVEQVSWHDAVEFCDRLSRLTRHTYRLPTEAEWEYACRAGTETPFHFGETITTDLANYRGEDMEGDLEKYPGHYGNGPKGIYRQETTPVNHFHPLANAFGLCDLYGNVWEWCLDHGHNYDGAPIDGSAWLTEDKEALRVLRGGSWDSNPRNCRAACRGTHSPGSRYNYNGFRLVCKA